MKGNLRARNHLLIVISILLCLTLCMTTLTGCGKEKAEETQVSTSDVQSNVDVNQTEIEDGMYIMLYMLNADSWDTEIDSDTEDADQELTTTLVAQIPSSELCAETIVNKYNEIVVQSLYGEVFTVNKVTHVDSNVIIDFDSASVKAVEITEGEEGQLFYNLARSIEENLENVMSIYFTMDGGKDFRLGHLWFEADRPFYSGRSITE